MTGDGIFDTKMGIIIGKESDLTASLFLLLREIDEFDLRIGYKSMPKSSKYSVSTSCKLFQRIIERGQSEHKTK